MSIEEMAKAHLQTVQKAIVDLQNQRTNIEEEIKKLTEYLKNGLEQLESGQTEDKASSETKE